MFDLSSYEPVENRIRSFFDKWPSGRIITDLVESSNEKFIVKAFIYRETTDTLPASTGYAEEKVGSSPVNRNSALENCETSAVGRALANLNFAPKGARPSREEMTKVASSESKPLVIAGGPMARAKATEKQVTFAKSMIKEIASTLEFDIQQVEKWACETYSVNSIEELSMKQISHMIADMQNHKKQGVSSDFYNFVRSKKGPDYDPWATPAESKESV